MARTVTAFPKIRRSILFSIQNRPAFAGRFCFCNKIALQMQGGFAFATKPSCKCRETLLSQQNRPAFAGKLCFRNKTVLQMQGDFTFATKPSCKCREALFSQQNCPANAGRLCVGRNGVALKI
jgi:hypothetical protein